MTLSIFGSFATLSITVLSAFMLIVIFYCYAECHGADHSCRKLASNIKRLNAYNYRTINADEKSFITLTPYLQLDHDNQHNDTQHIGLICDTLHNSIECHYAEYHFSLC